MTAVVLLATCVTAAAILWPQRARARRIDAQVDRLGPVRLQAGLRASKAAQAAASADGAHCGMCELVEAGPHWKWCGTVDAGGDA